MPKLKIIYPIRTWEFQVTFRGQNTPQCPVIEIVAVNESTHTHEMYATYDPHVGGAYDPNAWFIRMPHGIKMNEIRAIMRTIRSAVVERIAATNHSNLYVLVTAAKTLTDTVNAAIRDYVVNADARDYVRDYDNV